MSQDLPAPNCVFGHNPDGRTSFLHLEKIPRELKAQWVGAAAARGMKFEDWVLEHLNHAAASELPVAAPTPKPKPPHV